MLRDLAKLSLWGLVVNVFLLMFGDYYEKLVAWILGVSCIFGIFFLVLFYPRGPTISIPLLLFYFIIPLHPIMVSTKHGFREDFLVKLLCSELLCVVSVMLQYQDLTISIPREQKARARLAGCPGH